MRIIEEGSWLERRVRNAGSRPRPGSQPDATSQPEATSKPDATSQPEATSRPEAGSQPFPGSQPEVGTQPSPDPIEPDIGVNGGAVLWALIGIVVFFYHWGGALVFIARFALAGTPYALVEARATDSAPLRDGDVTVIRKRDPHLVAGQIVWIARGDGATRLEQVFLVGPATARPEMFVRLDSTATAAARSSGVITVHDGVVAAGLVGSTSGDTLAELIPRDRVLGHAVQVILPPHRIRALP